MRRPPNRETATFVSLLLFAALSLLPGCSAPTPGSGELYLRAITGEVFDTTPVRGEFKPLRNRRTGFEYRCTECHADFTSLRRQHDLPGEHAAVYGAFNHGLNANCLNCHNPIDRDAYADSDGSSIPADQPARLCAKCHGPIYREWETGIHGRQNGFWDERFGPRRKLLCVQCHDPHNPRFAPLTPDPPPAPPRIQRGKA